MFDSRIVHSVFNQRFILYSRQASVVVPIAEEVRFSDIQSAERFLVNLQVDTGFFRQLSGLSSTIRSAEQDQPVSAVARLLMSGQICVAPLGDGDIEEKSKRSINKGVKTYTFVSPAESGGVGGKPAPIAGLANTQSLVQSLNLRSDQVASIISMLALEGATNKSDVELIVDALIEGKIHLIETVKRGPVGEGGGSAGAEESASDTPGNRAVESPSSSSSSSASNSSTTEDKAVADQKAQAEAAIEAAENGTPFCEECEKKKAS